MFEQPCECLIVTTGATEPDRDHTMWKTVKRALGAIAVVLLVLIAIIAFNTARYTPEKHADVAPYSLGADVDKTANILSDALKIKTVSTDMSTAAFPAFLQFLQDAYPLAHATMTRDILDANTPLYKWEGSDNTLPPVLLAAHYDVVPVATSSLDRWTYPPFDGTIADGFIWGRGTLDDKGALIALMSAAEHLIETGFQPKRTVYLSFGGDEEVGGTGAQAVAANLRAQGVQLQWALDEGSFVLDDIIPGLDVPVASINLAEKGYVTVKLVARSPGGHSALPPRITAVGRVARAVDRLQNAPVPGGLDGVSAEFFDGLGRHFSIEKKVLFANTWLFRPVLEGVLSGSASTNAMLRTTTAPTMLSGSNKENVLPAEATATINFRLHPRDTVDGVLTYVKQIVDDPEIEIVSDVARSSPASPVASIDNPGYSDIEASILSVFGPVASVPGLTIAATDARHYALAADAAFRINPFLVTSDDINRFHGIDERLSLDNLERGINFYGALLTRQ